MKAIVCRSVPLLLTGLAWLAAQPAAPITADDAAVLWTASDGTGTVEIFWYPLTGWPEGGVRLERLTGGSPESVAVQDRPGDPAAIALLDGELRQEVEGLVRSIAAGEAGALESAFLRSVGQPAVGYAFGFRAHDAGGSGPRSYRLSGLAAGGRTLWSVESGPIDPQRASPRPGPALELAAERSDAGISLSWLPPDGEEGRAAAVAFIVGRDGGGATVQLTPRPLIALYAEGDPRAGFDDTDPPVGEEVAYRIVYHDLFGRAGPPAEVTVYVEDLEALEPPADPAATAEPGRVVVTWTPKTTPGTAGYRLERAFYHQGPYTSRSEQPLGRDVSRFLDDDVRPGTAYHYRLRSLDRRGGEGSPSQVASTIARGSSAPRRPTGLRAEAGRTRVRLRWEPAAEPIAGYLVERQTAGGAWARLDSQLSSEALFDDRLGPQDGGRLTYRVRAVAFDSELSEPSAAIEVELPDSLPPPRPTLLSIEAEPNGVVGAFLPGAPSESTSRFLVLRGGSYDDPGLVVGAPLDGSARSFRDPNVRHGADYWYRLVAVDAAGHHSEPSEPLRVRMPLQGLPQPEPPGLERIEPGSLVRVTFDLPPAELSVWIERRAQGEPDWLTLAGPLTGGEAVDVRPLHDRPSEYRLVYRSAVGASSPPSDPVALAARPD